MHADRSSFHDRIQMLRSITLLMAVAALAACAPKGQDGAPATGDSTASPSAFTDSATRQDSIGPARDPGAVPATGTRPRAGVIIGRDSAFGPTFTVDSTGKVTPIAPVKKKP